MHLLVKPDTFAAVEGLEVGVQGDVQTPSQLPYNNNSPWEAVLNGSWDQCWHPDLQNHEPVRIILKVDDLFF